MKAKELLEQLNKINSDAEIMIAVNPKDIGILYIEINMLNI